MIVIENKQVFSSEGKIVHRLGTDTYFKRSGVFRTDTIANFEAVEAIPQYTKIEYDAKVAELVRLKYTESEEFALQRKMLNTLISPMTLSEEVAEATQSEYAAYNEYVEQCKSDVSQAIIGQKEREEAERIKAEEEEAEKQRLQAELEAQKEAERQQLIESGEIVEE